MRSLFLKAPEGELKFVPFVLLNVTKMLYKEITDSCLVQNYLWGRSTMDFCLNASVNMHVRKDKMIIMSMIITTMIGREREFLY